jgi:Pectate lyase superfamily protein
MSEKTSSIKLMALLISVVILSICLNSNAELNNNTYPGVSDSAHLSLQVASREPPAYEADKFPSLAEAIKAIGTEKAVLMIRLEQPIRANLRVPANITLQFFPRAFLNIASDVTVTIDGTLHAGLFQIFSGPGTVTLSGPLIQAYPQWWGGRGDGITDDTLAIQKAINSARNIYLSNGTYVIGKITPANTYLENKLLTLRSNISISGNGRTSVLKLKDHLLDNPDDNSGNAHMMGGYDLSSITIKSISFDMNGSHNLTPPGKIRNAMAIFIMGGNNVAINNCSFMNCAGHNMITLRESQAGQKSYNALIGNNSLLNGGRYVGNGTVNINNPDFSFVYVVWDNSIVEGNLIQQENIDIGMSNYSGGIEIHGNNIKVLNNKIIGCYPAMYIATELKLDNIEIKHNTMLNCMLGISFFLSRRNVTNIAIIGNKILLTWPKIRTWGECCGIHVPNGKTAIFNEKHATAGYIEKLILSDNIITEYVPNGSRNQCIGMEIHSLHNTVIQNNTIKGLSGQGIVFWGSPWGNVNVDIVENTILNCGRAVQNSVYRTGILFDQAGFASVPALPYYAHNISFRRNVIGNEESATYTYHGITLIKIAETKLQNLNIIGNRFINVTNKLYDGENGISDVSKLNPEAHFIP